jgi:hypothetical protein
MKKSFILFTIAICVIVAACSKVKDLANISVDLPYSQQVSVPVDTSYVAGVPIPGGITLPFPSVPFATNSKDIMAQYKTSADKIIKVSLKGLSLQILSPAGQNFDFMDSIQIYMSATTQPEVLIAHQYEISKGQTTLTLVTDTSVNLKDYFVQDTISYRLTTHINATPPQGTQLNISSVFHLLANPL